MYKYICLESVSLHKLLYVSAAVMHAPEDSGSELGVSTWCLVSLQ